MTWGRVYWPLFLIATSLAFLGPEVFALIEGQKNTLSDYSWGRLEVVQNEHFWQHNAAWLLTLGVWLVIALWLTAHIWFRRFR
jgi:hypothetical protein